MCSARIQRATIYHFDHRLLGRFVSRNVGDVIPNQQKSARGYEYVAAIQFTCKFGVNGGNHPHGGYRRSNQI
ncbi:hypothetical protein DMI62_08505 [Escherichia coli]|nr:hypothetical protein [Escherichia coli]